MTKEEQKMLQDYLSRPIDPFLAARHERNRLLSSTDWTQIVDSPLTAEKKEIWKVYRQKLRDLFDTQKDPNNIQWPEWPA